MEKGTNTTYGVVKAYVKEYGIEKTRLAVYYQKELNHSSEGEIVAMAMYIDTRQARDEIRERLGGYKE